LLSPLCRRAPGGSFISFAISKWPAKKAMGVRVIEAPSNATEFWLVETVRKYSTEAGIKMPEVGIFETPEVNAFATGMSRNSSLVAVSSGLLQQMSARVPRRPGRRRPGRAPEHDRRAGTAELAASRAPAGKAGDRP
jgi:hypothetical protein